MSRRPDSRVVPLAFRAIALASALAGGRPAGVAGQRPDSVPVTAAMSARPPVPDSGTSVGARLPLDTVIARTLLNSPALVSATGSERTARSAERVALGAYLPAVSLNSMAGRSDQGVAGATAQSTGPQGAYGAGVSATLDLFTGGRRSAVRHETAAAARAADAGLILERYATRLLAKQGYFEVLRGHELVRVADDGVAVAEKSLTYARARAAAGTATPSDVLRAELALSTARRQHLAAVDTLATAAAALGRLVGADGPVDAEPLATLDPTPLALADPAVLAAAVREAPAVLQAEAQVTATAAAVRASKAQYLPTIQAGAGYSWANNSQGVSGALRQGWLVQVGASLPLFNGFAREDSVTRAQVSSEVARTTSADTRRLNRAESLRLLGSLHVAEQDVALTVEAVRVATEDLRVITVRYRGGIATILDQLTSQQNLVQAELDLVSARFTYQVTRATLEALLGREL
jgi:outer membrane protein